MSRPALRTALDYIFLFFKGLCIGATGVLQGVSGGSMALLLGIHEQFIFSIRAIDRHALRLLMAGKFRSFWKKINGSFLLVVFAGITCSLLTLRAIFNHYLQTYPILISSFFFSLVIIAALLLLRRIRRWTPGVFISIIAGLALSYFLTVAHPFGTPDNLLTGFLAGFLAGATFLIPGVSGSFIVIFFGKYHYILTSFDSLKTDVIVLFITGGILGIAVVARFLAHLLRSYYNATVGLFAGLMIGSLNKIWPWRQVYEYATTLQGKRIPAFDKSILPWRYLELTGRDPEVFYAILMMAAGVFIVVLIEKIAARLKTKS